VKRGQKKRAARDIRGLNGGGGEKKGLFGVPLRYTRKGGGTAKMGPAVTVSRFHPTKKKKKDGFRKAGGATPAGAPQKNGQHQISTLIPRQTPGDNPE